MQSASPDSIKISAHTADVNVKDVHPYLQSAASLWNVCTYKLGLSSGVHLPFSVV